MRPQSTLALIWVFVLVGCGARQEELVGRPPDEELVERGPRAMNIKLQEETKRARTEPEPLFALNGWPLMEEGSTFKLTWDAPRTVMKVVDEPSYNGILADEVVLERGQEMLWNGTAVGVFKPSRYRARESFFLEGFVHSPDQYRTGSEAFSAEIRPGETIDLYHYAGSGLCYMKVRNTMVEALCPPETSFDGNFRGNTLAAKYQPADSVWWVRIPGPRGGGWFPLDDRVVVDVVD